MTGPGQQMVLMALLVNDVIWGLVHGFDDIKKLLVELKTGTIQEV